MSSKHFFEKIGPVYHFIDIERPILSTISPNSVFSRLGPRTPLRRSPIGNRRRSTITSTVLRRSSRIVTPLILLPFHTVTSTLKKMKRTNRRPSSQVILAHTLRLLGPSVQRYVQDAANQVNTLLRQGQGATFDKESLIHLDRYVHQNERIVRMYQDMYQRLNVPNAKSGVFTAMQISAGHYPSPASLARQLSDLAHGARTAFDTLPANRPETPPPELIPA